MNTKRLGNIGLARALSYFSAEGCGIFLPVGDAGGAIDLIVTPDGSSLLRVQCKFTSRFHTAMGERYPDALVYEADLRTVETRDQRTSGPVMHYTEHSFDILFVSTPNGDFAYDWPALCTHHKRAPSRVTTGKRNQSFLRVNPPTVSDSGTLPEAPGTSSRL